jgi:hypothetical protein
MKDNRSSAVKFTNIKSLYAENKIVLFQNIRYLLTLL